jgi:acetoacetyl-CoA synthetase
VTREGDVLWRPSPEFIASTNLDRFRRWLEVRLGTQFDSYHELWRWSVDDVAVFWASIWEYFEVGEPVAPEMVLSDPQMPGARWFEGTELNFVEQIFRARRSAGPALICRAEGEPGREISWAELEAEVGALAAYLQGLGVEPGDRVGGYMPNVPEAVVAFLAAASLGAIWSCCAPDFGAGAVLGRLRQIDPKVLIAADGYRYAGKTYDRTETLAELRAALPSLVATIVVPRLGRPVPDGTETWATALSQAASLEPVRVSFSHPLWVLYTSGTTGQPKALVHGHGGVLLEYLKNGVLANDRRPEDVVFWFTSTSWVLWNMLVGSLLAGSTVVLYDGSPTYPSADGLFALAAETGATVLGCSPAYLDACIAANAVPKEAHDLRTLRSMAVSGAPLKPAAAQWIYDSVGKFWLVTGSGGTDVATAFVGAVPFLPVRAGQMQGRLLAVDAHAVDEAGFDLADEVGELVITQPMPSMPLFIWGDDDGSRYAASYFDRYPGIWRHGDWIKFTEEGAAVIYGRSDATINRRGLRLGTSELYRVIEAFPEVVDSLVVDLVLPDGEPYMPLFLVLREGAVLDDLLRHHIASAVRDRLSPRFVPDEILEVQAIPRTVTGKKLEVPVKRILQGDAPEAVLNLDVLDDPGAVRAFVEIGLRGLPTGRE